MTAAVLPFQGKVALVTGAGDGIGRGVALRYAAEGARVVVCDINDASGRQTLAMIEQAGGTGLYVRSDARSSADQSAAVEAAVSTYGRLDIACNNAGISGAMVPMDLMTDEQWLEVISLNLTGVFYGVRAQARVMCGGGGGSIVNIASILGAVGFATTAAYTAAKHGVVGLTKTAAIEYGAHQVRVNAVGPTFTKTSWINNIPAEAQPALKALHPLGRFGEVVEVVALVNWLSGREASYITGAYYPVDGGYLAA